MTTLETNTAPVEASGEGIRTPEKAVRWAIPLSLLACVLLAFFDKISIAALFSDGHFQQAMGIDFDTTRLGILMSAFLLSYGFSSVFLSSNASVLSSGVSSTSAVRRISFRSSQTLYCWM